MAHPDLITKCTTCRETLVIARESAQMARPITCPHCGTPAMVWQLIGRSQREIEVDDYAPQFPQKPFADSPGGESDLNQFVAEWLETADNNDRAALNPDLFESQRVNLNAAADALRSCALALQEALKQ